MIMDRRRLTSTLGTRMDRYRGAVRIAGCLMLMVLMVPGVQGGEYVDRIVAVVNDDIVTLTELNQQLNPYAEQVRAGNFSVEQERKMLFTVREKVLNGLIDQKLTDQEIKKANISVSDPEIDATIERIKEARFFTDEELRQVLRQQGMSMDEYRDQIRTQILRTKLINLEVKSKIVITQEDVAAYYTNHPEIFGGEKKYHLPNILLTPPLIADQMEKEAFRKKMATIVENLKKGASFEEMARMYSESPLAAEGGDLRREQSASWSCT